MQLGYTLPEGLINAARSETGSAVAAHAVDDQIRKVLPHIKRATDQYYSGYRHFVLQGKLGTSHTWDAIAHEQKTLEPLTLRELSTYLFYEIRDGAAGYFGRALGSTEASFSSVLTSTQKRLVRRTVRRGVDFCDTLFAEALAQFRDERYREAYLNLAIALEITLSKWVRRQMLALGTLSSFQSGGPLY